MIEFGGCMVNMTILLLDQVALTEGVLGRNNRAVVRPVAVLLAKKLAYGLVSFTLNYVGRQVPQVDCHVKIYRIWHIASELCFLTAGFASGCTTILDAVTFIACNWAAFIVKVSAITRVIERCPGNRVIRGFLATGRPVPPQVGPFRNGIRQYRSYELMVENASMTSVFLAYLGMYASFLAFVDQSNPAFVILFPSSSSGIFLLMFFVSDMVQDIVMAYVVKKYFALRLGNIFWRPWSPDSWPALVQGLCSSWPTGAFAFFSPFFICSSRGQRWLKEWS